MSQTHKTSRTDDENGVRINIHLDVNELPLDRQEVLVALGLAYAQQAFVDVASMPEEDFEKSLREVRGIKPPEPPKEPSLIVGG